MALEFSPGKTRIGWIGTGVMGSSMCGHLMTAGYAATVYNRTAEKARPLVDKGAKLSPTRSRRGRRGLRRHLHHRRLSPHDVRERSRSGPAGTLAGGGRVPVLVDMTTSEPALAVEIDARRRGQAVSTPSTPRSSGKADIGRARPGLDHDRRRQGDRAR